MARVLFLSSYLLLICSVCAVFGSESLPAAVLVDVGHSRSRSGAVSARGRTEFEFNRDMARAITVALRRSGVGKVILFNEEGASLSIRERVRRIKALHPLLVISIHHNSIIPTYLDYWTWKGVSRHFCDKFRGASVYFSEENVFADRSRDIAADLRRQMLKAGISLHQHPADELRERGIVAFPAQAGLYRFDALGVLRGPDCPAVLLECGMIVNRDEELLLLDKKYQRKLAAAVAQAVQNHVKHFESVAKKLHGE